MLDKSHDHLESVHENYWQHMRFALWFSARLIGAGLAVLGHAICPAIFQTAGSSAVNELHDILQKRKDHQHHQHHHHD